MKNIKYIISIFFFGFVFSVCAQITITENDLPEAGFTYLIANDTLTAVNLGSPSGTPQSWNYANLLNHYQRVPSYDSTNKTPYAGNFPSSTHFTYGPAALYSGFHGGAPVGTQGMNNGYMFWQRENNGFWVIGFRSDNGLYANKNVTYAPKELLIGTPSTLGSIFNNAARWELWLNANPANADTLYVKNIQKTLSTDAFGDLTLPSATYSDVVRVHELLVTVDSVYAFLNGNPVYALELFRDTLNNYMFLSNTVTYPVCVVHANKNNTVKSVEYYKQKFPLETKEETAKKKSIAAYPNPNSGQFKMEISNTFWQNKPYTFSLFDASGREIERQTYSSSEIYLNKNLSEGIYLYLVTNYKNETATGKLIISEK